MKIINTELALYGSKNECARTDNVFMSISEVCNCTISLDSFMDLLSHGLWKYLQNSVNPKPLKLGS